jgi:SAM-dependent methyltransferase
MNHFMNGVARAMAEAFTLPGPVVEIGSLQVDGRKDLIDLRSHFPGRPYQGVDFRPGPGVDLVANVENLPHPTGSVGTVLAFSVFEHVRCFWKGFDEVFRVLRPDGVLLLSTPFYFHQHGYPSDYWRFTPEAFDVLLDRYPTRVVGWHGPVRRPLDVWVAAFREGAAVPTAGQLAKYRELLSRYAVEPLGWGRRVRYGLGRVLCGRRPFAPHLDRNRWHTEVRTPADGTVLSYTIRVGETNRLAADPVA